MKVNIASDTEAYLKFSTDLGNSPHDNYEYADIENGQLAINFDENDAGGQGVNPNAKTYFDDVFALTNQGTEDVRVWFELDDDLKDHIDVYAIAGNYGRDNWRGLVGEDNAFSASWATGVGNSFRVGILVDLVDTEKSPEDCLEGNITVHAEAV